MRSATLASPQSVAKHSFALFSSSRLSSPFSLKSVKFGFQSHVLLGHQFYSSNELFFKKYSRPLFHPSRQFSLRTWSVLKWAPEENWNSRSLSVLWDRAFSLLWNRVRELHISTKTPWSNVMFTKCPPVAHCDISRWNFVFQIAKVGKPVSSNYNINQDYLLKQLESCRAVCWKASIYTATRVISFLFSEALNQKVSISLRASPRQLSLLLRYGQSVPFFFANAEGVSKSLDIVKDNVQLSQGQPRPGSRPVTWPDNDLTCTLVYLPSTYL